MLYLNIIYAKDNMNYLTTINPWLAHAFVAYIPQKRSHK